MEKLILRQRWMALPWGVYLLAIALVLAAAGFYGSTYYPNERPSVRLALPAYWLSLYLIFALLINWSTCVVTPQWLSVSVWPLIVRPRRRLRRDEIRHCFIRNVSTIDDGALIESYYSVGVESMQGLQLEISYPHNSAAEALASANQIVRKLNEKPPAGARTIEILEIEQPAEMLATIALIGSWLVLFIIAIFVGVAWEMQTS